MGLAGCARLVAIAALRRQPDHNARRLDTVQPVAARGTDPDADCGLVALSAPLPVGRALVGAVLEPSSWPRRGSERLAVGTYPTPLRPPDPVADPDRWSGRLQPDRHRCGRPPAAAAGVGRGRGRCA